MNTNTIKNAGFELGKFGLKAGLVIAKLGISMFLVVKEYDVIENFCNKNCKRKINKKLEKNDLSLKLGLMVGNYKVLNWLENKITDKIASKSDNLEQSINSENKEKLTLGKFALKTGLVITKLAISGVVGAFVGDNTVDKKIAANDEVNAMLGAIVAIVSSFATYGALNWLENKITDKTTGKSDNIEQLANDASTILAEDEIEAVGVEAHYEYAESL